MSDLTFEELLCLLVVVGFIVIGIIGAIKGD